VGADAAMRCALADDRIACFKNTMNSREFMEEERKAITGQTDPNNEGERALAAAQVGSSDARMRSRAGFFLSRTVAQCGTGRVGGRGAFNFRPPALSAPCLPRLRVPARAGLFSHVRWRDASKNDHHGRAFHLARSGRFTRLTEILTTLDREGYSASRIEGPLLRRQLTDLIKAARPDPLDRDLSRGVRGN